MGYREFVLKLPTDYQEDQIRYCIQKKLRLAQFTYQIEKKSLDARAKNNIHWKMRVGVLSSGIKSPRPDPAPVLSIPCKKGQGKVVVIGSGPAGFFAAFVLQKAGYRVSLVERGAGVEKRSARIRQFEKTGVFDPLGNYVFGEGGAGTFSDGKLTSRTKNISKEKAFVISCYMNAGAPAEIGYLAHPHLGSDNLRSIIKNLTQQFQALGGCTLFETKLEDLKIRNGSVVEAVTSKGGLEADHFIVAPGHSAYDTYRMLINRGVRFQPKNFAIGSRMEHPQELINQALWGRGHVPGVKAAEYRLTSKGDGNFPVYSFCMCPGGVVVPAAATRHTNIVNGMSLYARDGRFANAGCVAGININRLLGRDVSPLETLDWLESLEMTFFDFAKGFQAPSCGIKEFIDQKVVSGASPSSYVFGLKPAVLWELLPSPVSQSLREGLKDFNRKIKGFETGTLMGLESKTSSPIQALREKDGRCIGFDNLFIVGEGSGFAGGIISSAADGIKCVAKLF
ncbi:MAG: NAD(P)/FAD-dependent oxidoreductase [Desulfobacterales bacterium]|nr:NAD(P)/FAD-dependent oxidoreductase [Desulfobacterales bacterium]